MRIALGSVVTSTLSPEGCVLWMCHEPMSVVQVLRLHSRLLRMEPDGAKECWTPRSTSVSECLSPAADLPQRAQWQLGGWLIEEEAGASQQSHEDGAQS